MTRFYRSLPLLARWLFVAAFLGISLLAFAPNSSVVITTGWDKTNHLLAFLVLLWLLDMGWQIPVIYKCLALLLYGALIEVIQGMIPQRSVSIWDLCADGIGMGFYLLGRAQLLRWSSQCHQWLFRASSAALKGDE